ncbi:YdgA family protein [Marinomonas sp.]|uniref:YdgA family protein n=1 Tax=Marinomonas sp. TaxID=1904862 RepID=UPI003BA9DE12
MKKILAVLVFTLVAACLVAPKFIASIHQAKLVEIVENINKSAGYSATLISSNTAWFGSENKVQVSYDIGLVDPSLQGKKLETELLIVTHYGPLLFSRQGLMGLFATDVSITGEKQRALLSWDESQPLYQLVVIGGFSGNIKVADSIPAISNPADTIQFSGYSGQGELSAKEFAYQGTFDQLSLVDGFTPIKAENFAVSIELNTDLATLMSGSFYESTSDFNLDKLTVGNNTELAGLNIEVGSELDKDTQLGKVTLDYYIDNVIFAETKVSDLTLMTELTNLSNTFFMNLQKFSNNFSPSNPLKENNYEKLVAFMQDHVDELLSNKPEFNITKFSGSFPEGDFTSNLTSSFADIGTPTAEEFLSLDFWRYNTITKAHFEIDEPLLKDLTEQFIANKMRAPKNAPQVKQQVQKLLFSLVAAGIIQGPQKTVIKSDTYFYSSDLLFEKGQTIVNGTPLPLM